MSEKYCNDVDPIETNEWIEAIESVIQKEGIERANFLINKLLGKIKDKKNNFYKKNIFKSNYINSIPVEKEPKYPGNLIIEQNIRSIIRWNSIVTILNASKKNIDLGGHIASFQSSATLYEVCFNHFFRAKNKKDGGDIIYFQGHVSPGIYSRAFLEGRITEEQMKNFRQETDGNGLSSYPHPKLMPEFWQFPTVSMGLSSINAIYQAKFLKYLYHRKLKDTREQTVYAFLGDGEMDEPESKGNITIASRDNLDNLIFIINCNLQSLDGPVRGNNKIINELENIFIGAGWEVIKVIWGSQWDKLLKQDSNNKLVQLMNETVDGEYQNLKSKNGAYVRKHFFGKYKETFELVKNMSDEEIWSLNRGGHDPKKIYAAVKKAKETIGKPVVILAHTIKGYGMGELEESTNSVHQIKKMNIETIQKFKNRCNLTYISNKKNMLSYISLKKGSKEYNYLHKKRKSLYGYLPSRLKNFTKKLKLPTLQDFSSLLVEQKKEISTTMAFLRLLNIIIKKKFIKNHVVPIVADEARTFGIDGLFKKIGIYNPNGQKYTPQDVGKINYYQEKKNGQILQEGTNELGAASSWLAAATSYSTNNIPMIPFYIYYSMFGFQRIGDLCWAAGDQQARGFLIGGISGRTTLNGEGLQHGDGHSHIYSSTIPNCISYDPTYAYELAIIIHDGLIRMYGEKQENVYYYLTITNENYYMPSIPNNAEIGIRKGIYKLETLHGEKCKIQLIGSGALLIQIRKAAKILLNKYGISSDIYSVTSFTELAREGEECKRWNMLHPMEIPKIPYVDTILSNIPTVACTDYMKLFAEQIRNFISVEKFHVLGTDGFGRSDSREKLRKHFEVDTNYIIIASLNVLLQNGDINVSLLIKAIKEFKIDPEKINPRLA